MHLKPDHKRIFKIRRVYDTKERPGLVCRVGREWALVHVLDDLRIDGWECVRLKDIQSARRRSFDNFSNKVLIAERAMEGIEHTDTPLDDTRSLLKSLVSRPIVILECEGNEDFYLGKILRVGAKSAVVHYLDPHGNWLGHPYRILLEDITRVQVGDHYSSMFAKYAARPPKPESAIIRDRSPQTD